MKVLIVDGETMMRELLRECVEANLQIFGDLSDDAACHRAAFHSRRSRFDDCGDRALFVFAKKHTKKN